MERISFFLEPVLIVSSTVSTAASFLVYSEVLSIFKKRYKKLDGLFLNSAHLAQSLFMRNSLCKMKCTWQIDILVASANLCTFTHLLAKMISWTLLMFSGNSRFWILSH